MPALIPRLRGPQFLPRLPPLDGLRQAVPAWRRPWTAQQVAIQIPGEAAQLAKRLHLARLFRRKLAQMPFELADPVWIDDDDIDLDYHVRSVTLRRPGTMAQLEVLVARLHSSLLDRSRPLWEVYVIDGLANGQVAFYSKAHHSGVDGKAPQNA